MAGHDMQVQHRALALALALAHQLDMQVQHSAVVLQRDSSAEKLRLGWLPGPARSAALMLDVMFVLEQGGVYRPLEPSCTCMTCRTYSRAFLHNLVAKGLPFASHLVTYHNVAYTQVCWRLCMLALLATPLLHCLPCPAAQHPQCWGLIP